MLWESSLAIVVVVEAFIGFFITEGDKGWWTLLFKIRIRCFIFPPVDGDNATSCDTNEEEEAASASGAKIKK